MNQYYGSSQKNINLCVFLLECILAGNHYYLQGKDKKKSKILFVLKMKEHEAWLKFKIYHFEVIRVIKIDILFQSLYTTVRGEIPRDCLMLLFARNHIKVWRGDEMTNWNHLFIYFFEFVL
jgi:hypothetical protein